MYKIVSMLFMLVLLNMNIAYAELQVTYFQTEARIVKILENEDLLCEGGVVFKQGNDQIKNLKSYVGKNIYIKYFNLLKNKFYVDVKSSNDGEFDLKPVKAISSTTHL